MTRTLRFLAALALALPLLVALSPPASADTCAIVSYGPSFTNSDWQYLRGQATMTCAGSDTTFMELHSTLQERTPTGTYVDIPSTKSGWHNRTSSGTLAVWSFSKFCATGATHVYRTRATYSWKTIYSVTSRYNLYSVPVTKSCGP